MADKNNLTVDKVVYLVLIGLVGWLIPGGGHFLLRERARGWIIFGGVVTAFLIGIYVGSIAVIDPVNERLWYILQMLNSPLVSLLGNMTARTDELYVYGKPAEIGQIYTSMAGMLNLLCVVHAVYTAHVRGMKPSAEEAAK